MACLRPFRALRPVPAAAPDVAAVPYDVVTTDEARTLAGGNPLSFLHVSRAEIDLPPGTDPYGAPVYEQAAASFARLQQAAPLVREDRPALYVYRLRLGSHTQFGVAGAYSLDEYDRDVIRKHERTRRDKEDDRTRHMRALSAQTGPVFLTYRASGTVDDLTARVGRGTPLIDFVAADEVQHTIWRCGEAETEGLVHAFGRLSSLYIADGHHRAASAARARREIQEQGSGTGAADVFLAVAFPHDQVRILPYHRIVRDLGGRSPAQLVREIEGRAEIGAGAPAPARKGEISMHLGGRWYAIRWPEATASDDPIRSLDVSRLQDHVLAPLLGITDVRTDKRIDFVGGIRGTAALERLVNSGEAAVAFSMFPVSVDDLMAIADAGGIMPPKSTWFEPKLRDGLLIHVID